MSSDCSPNVRLLTIYVLYSMNMFKFSNDELKDKKSYMITIGHIYLIFLSAFNSEGITGIVDVSRPATKLAQRSRIK